MVLDAQNNVQTIHHSFSTLQKVLSKETGDKGELKFFDPMVNPSLISFHAGFGDLRQVVYIAHTTEDGTSYILELITENPHFVFYRVDRNQAFIDFEYSSNMVGVGIHKGLVPYVCGHEVFFDTLYEIIEAPFEDLDSEEISFFDLDVYLHIDDRVEIMKELIEVLHPILEEDDYDENQ